MAVYKRDIVDINLETGNIHRSFLKHSIGYLDQKADHFGIRAFRNGEPVNLTGISVQGVFMPPQGSPIAITSGNIVDGNIAEVVLPQACYNYDGQFTLAIKLVDPSNAVTGTMRIVDGMVDNTHASGTVAPVAAIPSYQEVLSTYEQAIAAINKTVRFDAVQSLTDTQKATARGNISAPSVADLQAETTAREAADTAINNALDVIGEKVPNLYNADGVILGKNWAGEDAADRAYIQIPVTAGMTYTIIVPTNANIPQVAVVQLNSVPASLDSFYVTGGDRETFTAVTNCVSIRIQFEGSTTLSAANFENYNVYVFEGTEEYFSAVDKIARSKLPERKYIFIGDSYCEGYNPDGNVTGWGERLKTAMGLNNSNCIISYKGGTGFYHVSDGKTFSTLLDEAGTGIDKNAITDIVVCGGWNDNTESVTNVYFNGVLPFATKVTNEYPNAILYVGMIGASNNADVRLRLQSVVLYAYQYGALRANYRYLNYVENALSESDLATDGIHPNEDGQVAITIAIKQALTTGSSGTKKIDATLSQSGVAADAQATGNAVGNEATARQNADALKVNISDIENDLTGTTAGKVLDARQGKVLDDKITAEAATRAAADSDLKSALNDSFASVDGRDLIQFKKGFYIDTSGSTVDISDEHAGSSYAYAVVDCLPGDIFTINGTGGGTPRLWAFIDSASPANRLSVSATSASANNLMLQAPASAAKLVLNTKSIKPCYKGVPVSFEISRLQDENSNQTAKQYSEYPYPQKNEGTASGTTIVLNEDNINGLKMTSTKGLIYPVNIFKPYLVSSPMSSDNSHFTVTIENGGYKIVKDTSNTGSRYTKNMPITVPFDGYIYASCDAHSTHKRKDITRLQLAKQDGTVLTEYASGDGHLMCGAYVHANDSIVIRCYGGAPDTEANTWYYENIMLSYSPFAKYETNKGIESNYDNTLEIGYLTGTNKSLASTAIGTQYVQFDSVITSPFLPADNEVSGILQTLNSDTLTPVSFDDLYNAQQDNLIAISSSGHLCIFRNSAGHIAVEEWARSIGLSLRFVPSSGTYTGSEKLHTFRAGEVIKYESSSSVSFFTGNKPKRKILCFGDSVTGMFTNGSGYVGALNQMNHDVEFVNCGFAGERWTDHSNSNDVPFSMNRLADAIVSGNFDLQDSSPFVDPENANYKPLFAEHLNNIKTTDFTSVDMITIFYGLNDFASHVYLNSSDDPAESNKQRSNVEDAVQYTISQILTAYPNLTICVISPYWSYILSSNSNTTPNNKGKYLYEYCNVIENTAKANNMPTINLYYSMGVTIYNYQNFFLDNTHPNYRLSKAIANRINQIVGNYN